MGCYAKMTFCFFGAESVSLYLYRLYLFKLIFQTLFRMP